MEEKGAFEKICARCALALGGGFAFILFYWTCKYKHEYPLDYGVEKAFELIQPRWQSILIALLVLAVSFLVQKVVLPKEKEKQAIFLRWMTIVGMVVIGGALLFWVFYSNIQPYWDNMEVYLTALRFRDGNYESMAGYMEMWPHQYGLTFVYELLFAITFNTSYKVVECWNVLCILAIIFLGKELIREWFDNYVIQFYYLIAIFCFFPLYVYVTYVYGDVSSAAAAMVATWALTKWIKEKQKRYAVILLATLSFGVLARQNTLIYTIAICIVLLVYGISEKKWMHLGIGILSLVLPLLVSQGVRFQYELRSGIEVGAGIPAISYVMMGTQESYNGCGVYTGYVNSVYRGSAQGDASLAAQLSLADLKVRLAELRNDKAYARDFYRRKVVEQWSEGTFGAFIMNAHFDGEPKDLVETVYYGAPRDFVVDFMNRYLAVIYLGVLGCAIYLFVKKPSIIVTTPIVMFIGGMLFSILWEAKSRYVVGYVIMLLPCLAIGIYYIQQGAVWGVQTLLQKWKEKRV